MKINIGQMLALLCAAAIMTGCSTTRQDAGSWEYKVLSGHAYAQEMEKQINELAGQGWTVVSISTSFQGENMVPRAVTVLRRSKK